MAGNEGAAGSFETTTRIRTANASTQSALLRVALQDRLPGATRRRASIGLQLEIERRVRDLPRRCEMLLIGLDNADSDPSLIFEDLPYADVMAMAQRHEVVARALKYYQSGELVPFDPDSIAALWGETAPPAVGAREVSTTPTTDGSLARSAASGLGGVAL